MTKTLPVRPLIHVVDDDPAVRDSIELLCETAGFAVRTFAGAASLLAALEERPDCILLDVRMPGMSGPELQSELLRRGVRCPVVFLTAYGDVPTTVSAMKQGARDFLCKPVDGTVLVETLREACRAGAGPAAADPRCDCVLRLTLRERQIMKRVIDGQSSKAIARALGISFRTVEIHRSHILHKTGAANVLDLARLGAACASALRSEADDPINSPPGPPGAEG